jgi:uncharacterized membrane protein YedE/YeeE
MTREWKVQGFHDGPGMWRYLIGATLMGFGGMLAGGCAVGAGVTGGAIFALTAWIALAAMWAGAIATHLVLDGKVARSAQAEPSIDSGSKTVLGLEGPGREPGGDAAAARSASS